MINSALILCGGKGKRLKKRVNNIPKILAKIADKPFIDYQIDWLEKQRIKKIYLLTKYKSSIIENYIHSNKSKYNSKIIIIKEKEFLGTGGAIKNLLLKTKLNEHCLVVNGDTYFNIKKINYFYKFHFSNNNKITLGSSIKIDSSRYGTIKFNGNYLKQMNEPSGIKQKGYVFAGLLILNLQIINSFSKKKFQLEDFISFYKNNNKVGVYKFKNNNFFYDYGTVKSYDWVANSGF